MHSFEMLKERIGRKDSRPIALLCLLVMMAMTFIGCPETPPPPPPNKLVIKAVQITSPAAGGIYNAENDSDKASPGIQVNVEVALTIEGTGDFPTGVKAELSTNNKRVAPVDVKNAKINFENYTLEEGANTLQVKVTLADGTVLNSNAVLLTADSKCYQIEIVSPKDGTLLGARDDENANTPDMQQTIIVKVSKDAVEPVKLTIRNEQGQENTLERKPFDGEVAFDEVTLPNGAVTLTASIEDGAGNKCSASSKLTVRVDAPAVEITSPTADKKLCPSDDKDPQANDFQIDVTVKTSAQDKSEATLFLDGRKLNTTVVSNGQAVFRVTLSAIQEEFGNKLKASIKDTLGNTGESKEVSITGRSRGYELGILNILDGQQIAPSRDKDPNKPGIQVNAELSTSAPDGTTINLTVDGKALTGKATNGKATFLLDLKEGQNCIEGSIKEASCSIETKLAKLCVTVTPIGVPTITCALTEKNAPAFDGNDTTNLNPTHDADDQTADLQNTLRCQSDAEKDQTIEFELNGAKQTKPLVDGQGGLREVIFDKLTFKDGANTIKVKVTNKLGKSANKVYTINVDTTAPSGITDLAAQVVDHRQSSVKLLWTAPGDGGKAVTGYEVRYSSLLTEIKESEWDKPEGKLEIKTAKAPGAKDENTILNLSVLKSYVFAIRAKDASGNLSPISNIVKLQINMKSSNTSEGTPVDQVFANNMIVAGDLDKDGVQDIVVTEPLWNDNGKALTGAIHVYYGRKLTTGNYLPAAPDVTIVGEGASNLFGQHVAALGDINGDGFADFAVSSSRTNSTKGRVYFVFGGQRGTSIKAGKITDVAKVIISGTTAGSLFGYRMAAAGINGQPDLNGDQKADLIVSAPSLTLQGKTTKGVVHVFYSRASYPSGAQPALSLSEADADITFQNDNIPNGNTGTALFGNRILAHDLNKDGKTDIIFSAISGDTVLGYFGPLTPTNKIILASAAQLTIKSKTGGQSLGTSLSIPGDVDKDGKLELLVSANRGQATGRPARSGQVFLFSGTKLLSGAKLDTATDAAVSWYGVGPDTLIDASSPAGDVNGDGFDDFIIAEGKAPDAKNVLQTGSVYLFFGRSKFSDIRSGRAYDVADYKWYGTGADTRLGYYSIIGGVDLTGDNKPDFLFAESPNRGKNLKAKILFHY